MFLNIESCSVCDASSLLAHDSITNTSMASEFPPARSPSSGICRFEFWIATNWCCACTFVRAWAFVYGLYVIISVFYRIVSLRIQFSVLARGHCVQRQRLWRELSLRITRGKSFRLGNARFRVHTPSALHIWSYHMPWVY